MFSSSTNSVGPPSPLEKANKVSATEEICEHFYTSICSMKEFFRNLKDLEAQLIFGLIGVGDHTVFETAPFAL